MRTLVLSFTIALASAVGLTAGSKAPPSRGEVVVTEQALAIHRDALLIDGHNDLPYELRAKDGPSFRNIDLTKPQKAFNTDIERLRKGNVGAQFWSAYVPVATTKKGIAIRMT